MCQRLGTTSHCIISVRRDYALHKIGSFTTSDDQGEKVIDQSNPDYEFNPASDAAPEFHYGKTASSNPLVSIITSVDNGSLYFMDTVKNVRRSSFINWEWIVVDARTESGVEPDLLRLQFDDPRMRILLSSGSNKAKACNVAATVAQGKYLFLLDSGDLIEPVYLEQAVWILETRPWLSACNAHGVLFGSSEELVGGGFHDNEWTLDTNRILPDALIRRDDYLAIDGIDESYSTEMAEWDLWLKLAASGKWGYTISDYMIWRHTYRWLRSGSSTASETQCTRESLQKKYANLRSDFPHPKLPSDWDVYREGELEKVGLHNLLDKPPHVTRVLLVLECLFIGGADKFNLDFIEELSSRGYEFTVIVTSSGQNDWYSAYSRLTPDIFIFPKFQMAGDSIHFVDYLIESRQIDVVFITHSQIGYYLLPYLRAKHLNLPMVDYIHIEEKVWRNGGYPQMSLDYRYLLDYTIASTEHLRQWMLARGANPGKIMVCHTNIDSTKWNPMDYNPEQIRARFEIKPTDTFILFVGRIHQQKRPMLYAQIIEQLSKECQHFVSTAVGVGPDLNRLQEYVTQHELEPYIRIAGALPNETVRQLMAAADILLLPSDNEGLALVLFECLAMETVAVAADVGGHSELVTPECGYLIPHGEREMDQYVDALKHLIGNPTTRMAMATAGRRRVSELFSLGQMADALEEGIHRGQENAARRSPTDFDETFLQHVLPLSIEYVKIHERFDWSQPWHRQVGSGNEDSANSFVDYLQREVETLRAWGESEHDHHMAADQAYKDAMHQIEQLDWQLQSQTSHGILDSAKRIVPRSVKHLVKRTWHVATK